MVKHVKKISLGLAAAAVLATPFVIKAFNPTAPVNFALKWDNHPIGFYCIYQRTTGTNFQRIGTSTTNYFALSLVPSNYTFAVTASNGWGESDFSNLASTPPLPSTPVSNVRLE